MELSDKHRREAYNTFKHFGIKCDICHTKISLNPFNSKGEWESDQTYYIGDIDAWVCKSCYDRFNRNLKNGHPEKNILEHCKLCDYPIYSINQAIKHVQHQHMDKKSRK